MERDLNKILEKDARGRLADIFDIVYNESDLVNKSYAKDLKDLFEPELSALKAANRYLSDRKKLGKGAYDPGTEEGYALLIDTSLRLLNDEAL